MAGQGGDTQEISLEELTNRAQIGVMAQLHIEEVRQRMEGTRRLWRLRDITTYTLLGIFAMANLATISMFFLNGLKITELTDVAMGSLAAATIAEVAGILTIVVKGLFSEEEPS